MLATVPRTLLRPLAAFLIAPWLGAAVAQSAFHEDFENLGTVAAGEHGPAGLIAAGWEFRNQSAPLNNGDWRPGTLAQLGSGSLYVDTTVGWWQSTASEASSWALLPAIPGQATGDEVRFYYSNLNTTLDPSAHLELRYSPSGGTTTGSGPGDVGDYTTVLADIPDLEVGWTQVSFSVPGSGRLAFRFHIPAGGPQNEFFGDFTLDELSVAPPPQPPVVPNSGETVFWTSPTLIDSTVTIPAGGTVVVSPGVRVDFQNNATLWVNGRLEGQGGGSVRTLLRGSGAVRVGGELELFDADIDLLVGPENGGSIVLDGATFTSGGGLSTILSATYLWTYPAFVSVANCHFEDSFLSVSSCTVLVRSTTMSGSYCGPNGYPLIEGLSIDGSPFDGLTILDQPQHVYLDDVTVTNSGDSGLNVTAANVLIGPSVTLAGNAWPAQVSNGGFLPGTTLPGFGNANDELKVEDGFVTVGHEIWSDVGIPYAVVETYSASELDVLPGVNIKLGPNVTFWGDLQRVRVRGLPDDPVVIERLDPAQSWQGLQYFHRFENAIVDGGQVGVRFYSASGPGYIDNCILRNNDYGSQNNFVVRKTQFIDNLVGSWNDSWPDALDGASGGNSFEGNGVAVDNQGKLVDAPNNWWGSPTGPTSPANPGGEGQVALNGTQIAPFLTSPPDFDDDPPIVNLSEHSWLLEAGSKVILTWEAYDDVGIASQRIVFDDGLNPPQVVANPGPNARAFEWTVPDIGFIVTCTPPELRVIATDTAGQEGWDDSVHTIPSGEVTGDLTILTDLAGPFTSGEEIEALCWSVVNGPPFGFSIGASVHSEVDGTAEGLGGVTSNLSCLALGTQMPFLSTDSARVSISIRDGSCNRVKYFFSDEFAIRPDARLGDAAPGVQLLSPLAGQVFGGGSTVPITWTASDDEGLRGFHVQASYDGGRTWHFIAKDLPANATGYGFKLPPSAGIPDARVRVIAVDLRFQNSSDGRDVSFQIASSAGAASYCQAKPSSIGCLPAISGSGIPSASSAQPFDIVCDEVISQKSGLLFYGYDPSALPFQGGTKCVSAPTRRTPIQSSGGNQTADCSGGFTYDFNARIQSGADPMLVPGQDVYAQYWYRDPQAVGTTGLSDGLAFTIQP